MSPYTPHNGRETRGVLAESGHIQSSWVIDTHSSLFLSYLRPAFSDSLLVCFQAFGVVPYGFSLSSQAVVSLGYLPISGVHPAAFFASLYSYWTALCTFNIPWRFRRDHVSHMRLDHLRRVLHPRLSSGTPRRKRAHTIVLSYTRCFEQGPIHLMGRWRSLHAQETMSDLGAHGLRHFILPFRVLGGAPGKFTVRDDGAVVDEHSFEQCALSADGTLKDSEDIEFGPDPGTPPPEASGSRPSHGKNPRYREIIDAEAERIWDDDKPAKSKRKRKTHTTKGKEKATESDQESAFSADSERDSDSEAGAELSNEELAESLPTRRFRKAAHAARRTRMSTGDAGKNEKSIPTKREPIRILALSATCLRIPLNRSNQQPSGRATRNPIWYFFTGPVHDHHKKVNPGNKFYRCLHGESKEVLRMTNGMRGSLNGLIGHLKHHAPDMHKLFLTMSSRKERKQPLTTEAIEVAEGKISFTDREETLQFLNKLTIAGDMYQQSRCQRPTISGG
ncbi:hypothetical protein DFH08DRAFT_826996 [Mycena albidolilacea]|uniref:Uncharacterized protein n=1 Tax=Mycena albidolilacea TaxID=1033008 RepID=A0AAD6Z004_9AGAR|nr:hypothetical protein DFH08DRAFT_826996 [Mycena albidolilacea]